MSELLAARSLTVEYRGRRTLRDVSLSIAEGEILGVVGRSGAGKSILVRSLINLVPPPGKLVDGEVHAFGADLRAIDDDEARRLRGAQIGVMVQNPRAHLNPLLRIGRQISNVYRAHVDATKDEARDRAVQVLRDVGIPAPERRFAAYPHELSGGMAQRAMIAMALVCDPRLLIADEPTSGLDVTIQDQILKLFRRAVDERDAGGILVTRDMGIVARFCDRVAVMHEGAIVEEAAIPAFFSDAAHPVSARLIASASFAGDGVVAPDPAMIREPS